MRYGLIAAVAAAFAVFAAPLSIPSGSRALAEDAPKDVKGIDITTQGKRDLQTAALERRIDARGRPYFWIGFKRVRSNPPAGTDLRAIYDKRISVTPLHLNLTEIKVVGALREKFKAHED